MTSAESTRTVSVHVRLPAGVDLTTRSVLRARVEDSSTADRAPDVVGRAEVPVPQHPEGDAVQLDIEVPTGLVDDRSSYTVFVHLDATGTGSVEAGDALSTQVVPVLTGGSPDEAEVLLREV